MFDGGAQEHCSSLKPFEMVVKIFTIEVCRRRVLLDAGFEEALAEAVNFPEALRRARRGCGGRAGCPWA